MVVIFVLTSGNHQVLVDAGAVGITISDGAGIVVLEEDVLVVVKVTGARSKTISRYVFDYSPAKGVIDEFDNSTISGDDLDKPVLVIPFVVCRSISSNLLNQVTVLVITVASVVNSELVRLIVDVCHSFVGSESVSHRIVGIKLLLLLNDVWDTDPFASGVAAVARGVGERLGKAVDGIILVRNGFILSGVAEPIAGLGTRGGRC